MNWWSWLRRETLFCGHCILRRHCEGGRVGGMQVEDVGEWEGCRWRVWEGGRDAGGGCGRDVGGRDVGGGCGRVGGM